MYIDSHCHLEMESFDRDRERVIRTCMEEGISYILTVGTEERYFQKVIEIVEDHAGIYGALGIHPHNSKDLTDAVLENMERYLGHIKIVALGEIGLDFFKNYSPEDSQISAFRRQIDLAYNAGLPVIIHSRDAKEETLKILKDMRHLIRGGVVHCYSYGISGAKELLDMGFYISIPGTVTYRKEGKLREVIRYIPLERMLSETDAPFLAPVPFRGKRNLPCYVKYTVAEMASIKGIGVDVMAEQIKANFFDLFPVVKGGISG